MRCFIKLKEAAVNLNINRIIRTVCSKLDEIVEANSRSFNDSRNFKVRLDGIYGKYYLDRVSGSYEDSLQNLIHKILWKEGLYEEIITNKKTLSLIENIIENHPDEIFKPDIFNAIDTYEEKELENLDDLLNEIYFKSIIYTRGLLHRFPQFDASEFKLEGYNHPMHENLSKIRKYTLKHPELMKCHHFLYDLPLNKTYTPDVVVLGINPGETEEDFKLTKNIETDYIFEESQQFDFHDLYGKGREKSSWKRKCEEFTGTKNILCSEIFFWSSPHPSEKSPPNRPQFCFSDRFGYKFEDAPHFDFCTELNIELFEFYKPQYILMPGVSMHEKIAELFNLKFIEVVNVSIKQQTRSRTYKAIIKYMMGKTPFIFTQHISGAFIPMDVKTVIMNYLHQLID